MSENWKSSEKFKEMRDEQDLLAEKVKLLTEAIKTSPFRAILLNQLILAIQNFDSHHKDLIQTFPDYYQSCKEAIDNLQKANKNYIAAVEKELQEINNTKQN